MYCLEVIKKINKPKNPYKHFKRRCNIEINDRRIKNVETKSGRSK